MFEGGKPCEMVIDRDAAAKLNKDRGYYVFCIGCPVEWCETFDECKCIMAKIHERDSELQFGVADHQTLFGPWMM